MGTRSAVFDGLGPPCAAALHEWERLGTWTVYCRRCYHHHGRVCRCPACTPATPSRRNHPTQVVGSGRTKGQPSDGQQYLLPFLEMPA
jgi:hypothetical protein